MRQWIVFCFGILVCAFATLNFQARVAAADKAPRSTATGYQSEVVDYVNEQIRGYWKDNEIEPSDVASDGEWLRRVYLDLVGHIPPITDVEAFIADKDEAKRSKLIDRLLDDPDYVRNWTTIWTNLTIGRVTPERVNRAGMEKFFREAFARNRPWNDVVVDLITAQGNFRENGAVNYLLAQLPDPQDPNSQEYAVQATAKTTRLFMGVQVQCTQCHDHPSNNWKQDQFWQFNSFFRQVARIDHRKYDPAQGRQVDDYSELVPSDYEGPVYFWRRSAVAQVAYPTFFGTEVDPGRETDRRGALAKLMFDSESQWVATALVNRMWAHFCGYGFTRPIDDMGPHNAPSHPDLVQRLTNEFVKSGYDQKQLMRWICNSEPYQLTSRETKKNAVDNPAGGERPAFSRAYVRSMEAEQLYDSLLIATAANETGRSDWTQAEAQRREWLQQFVVAFGTDENDETTTFNGTIPQALMMMNGDLVQSAISTAPGSLLAGLLADKKADGQKIRRLFLITLGRDPTSREASMANKLIRSNPDRAKGYQDLLWSLLNSNEFILIH